MSVNWDAAIVGAGVGGLAAAALLAHRGKRVIVCERLAACGGRARNQHVDGYTLPNGAISYAPSGALANVCKEVGAQFSIRELEHNYFWLNGGDGFVEMPRRGTIMKAFEILSQVKHKDAVKVGAGLAAQMSMAKIGTAFKKQQPLEANDRDISFRQWLERYTDDEDLLALFHSITSTISQVNDYEYPARHWFAHTSESVADGRFNAHALVDGGFQALGEALADVVIRHGGEVRLSTPVARIQIEGGQATGLVVKAASGEETINADLVISNTGPLGTLALAGDDAIGSDYASAVRKRVRPTPITVTFLISDEPLMDASGMAMFAGLKRVVCGLPVTRLSPEAMSEGKHIVALYGTPRSCLHPMQQDEERQANIDDARTIFPDMADKGGRVLAVQLRDIDDPDVVARSWPGYETPVTTPVPNLFNVGDGCAPIGYVASPAAAKSAYLAVEAIESLGAR